MKNPHSAQNISISSKSVFSIHPIGKFLASSEHCACAKSLCRHPELLPGARRLQYFSPPCSASLQSIWEMLFPSCVHFTTVPTASVSPRLEPQEKVKAPKLKSSITMFLAPSLPLPPPLQLLAVTPPNALGYSLTKCNFSSVQAHLAGLGLTRDLLHLKPKPNKNKQNPTNQPTITFPFFFFLSSSEAEADPEVLQPVEGQDWLKHNLISHNLIPGLM